MVKVNVNLIRKALNFHEVKMNQLFVVSVNTSRDDMDIAEIDAIAFGEFGCVGKLDFQIDEATVDEMIGAEAYCGGDLPKEIHEQMEKALDSSSRPKFYWKNEQEAKGFIEKLTQLKIETSLELEKDEDWNAKWREGFSKITVSPTLSVVPSWEKNVAGKTDILVYPGMGFGTGNHETTFLCLKIYESIEGNLERGHECLDFGCGSGILGIAPIKRKNARVDFVDIDVDALDNCLLNLNINDYDSFCSGHSLVLRSRYEAKEYDLVFANILQNVLLDEFQTLSQSTKLGGKLIISGLLLGQEEEVLKKYTTFECLKREVKGDWQALLLEKVS